MKYIYCPVAFPTQISQKFGENRVCVKGNSYISKETAARCPAGYAPLYKVGHGGIDFPAKTGDPIYCAANGRAVFVGEDDMRGNKVAVLSSRVENGEVRHFIHQYAHLSEILVHLNQTLKIGDLIGKAGATGAASGPHLHFDFYETDASGAILHPNNGYLGASDPLPYMHEKSAESIGWVRRLAARGIISIQRAFAWLL